MTFPLDEGEVRSIEERLLRASDGPWTEQGPLVELVLASLLRLAGGPSHTFDDLQFMLHARDDVPALLDELERLEGELEKCRSHGEWLSARYLAAGMELAKELGDRLSLGWQQAQEHASQLIEENAQRKEQRR
jgi:hypothetical protein